MALSVYLYRVRIPKRRSNIYRHGRTAIAPPVRVLYRRGGNVRHRRGTGRRTWGLPVLLDGLVYVPSTPLAAQFGPVVLALCLHALQDWGRGRLSSRDDMCSLFVVRPRAGRTRSPGTAVSLPYSVENIFWMDRHNLYYNECGWAALPSPLHISLNVCGRNGSSV